MAKFKNKDPSKKPKNLLHVLKWRTTSKKTPWPNKVLLLQQDVPPATILDGNIRISFVGHATFLIQTDTINILTDPIWSERASPFSNIGPKRVTPPGIEFKHLPKIDLVLISHNHYDHLDIPTISALWDRDKPQFIVPLRNDELLKKIIPNINVLTLNWHEQVRFNEKMVIHLEPAQHWSRRKLNDLNYALWGTFIIKTDLGPICFIGDSGYDPKIFKKISEDFGNMFISLIPIGAFLPRWFMQHMHMNPEEAVKVHLDLKSHYSIASHFETFPLADDAFNLARTELQIAKKTYHIADDKFIIPEIGSVFHFNNQSYEPNNL